MTQLINVCVTKEDAEKASAFEEQHDQGRACWCPNAIALCRALGVDLETNIENELVTVQRSYAYVQASAEDEFERTAALPEAAKHIVDWFDNRHSSEPEPTWPVCYELEITE